MLLLLFDCTGLWSSVQFSETLNLFLLLLYVAISIFGNADGTRAWPVYGARFSIGRLRYEKTSNYQNLWIQFYMQPNVQC